ncbi:MAG TPA: 6-pyruvoyl-tetrahydropterin synthase-related protein [Candidatus Saccharimonadales bacterium]|nr:6-pyruvoyl-tetrahydropterin synthase-related protein [Candidatus Saccharimonadales bacterium]
MKKKIYIAVLILLGIFPLFGLFHSGLPVTHDGQDHVIRLANFYKNLTDGIIIPRWAPNVNYGFGDPIFLFFYPLPYYLASLFHFLSFSFIDSAKIVYGLGFVLSGISMFLFGSELFGDEAGFVSGLLYMFSAYRFVDIYVRGDIGENLAFVFVPLIFYFLVKLSAKLKYKYIVGASFSLALLILSHNAISIMMLPLIALFCLFLAKEKKGRLRKLGIFGLFFILGFALSAFFWLPGLMEGKYTLREIVTKGGYLTNFVDPKALLYGPWSYGGSGEFTVQIGLVNIAAFILSIPVLFYKRKKNKQFLFIVGLLVYSLAAVFLMLWQSNILWEKIRFLQNFQFPWRFLAVTVFTTSFLAGFVVSNIPKRYLIGACIVLTILILFFNRNYEHADSYEHEADSFFAKVHRTTTNDTGESSPIWSVRFMEQKPNAAIEFISGSGDIKQKKRTTTLHQYIATASDSSRLRENTLYFPGWEVRVDNVPVELQFQDPKSRGLMTFFIPAGTHAVTVALHETKLRLLADIISLVTFLGILIASLYTKQKGLWKRFR